MTSFQSRFDRCLELFEDARDKDGSALSMYAFAADADGHQRNHIFGDKDENADLRSVSKVVAGLVLGQLISSGTVVGDHPITLDTEVEPLLNHHMNATARRQWQKVRVLHLLNNTIGHKEGFLFRKDLGMRPESEYLAYIFDRPIDHEPGTHFSYSNVGPFLFSVLLQDWLKKSLHVLAREFVLDPLGIRSEWRHFGNYDAGCTGLSIKNGDLIKLAALVRDGQPCSPKNFSGDKLSRPESDLQPRDASQCKIQLLY